MAFIYIIIRTPTTSSSSYISILSCSSSVPFSIAIKSTLNKKDIEILPTYFHFDSCTENFLHMFVAMGEKLSKNSSQFSNAQQTKTRMNQTTASFISGNCNGTEQFPMCSQIKRFLIPVFVYIFFSVHLLIEATLTNWQTEWIDQMKLTIFHSELFVPKFGD